MAWGTIISAAIQGAVGLYGAQQSANQWDKYGKEMAGFREYLKGEKGDNLDLTMKLLAQEQESQGYYRKQQDFRDMMMLNARNYEKDRLRDNLAQLYDERGYDISRQGKVDQAAQRDRLYEIERIAENANLSKQERAFANRELMTLKKTLEQERGYEIGIHDKSRTQAGDERAWRIAELRKDQAQAMAERKETQQIRDRYTRQIEKYSDELGKTRKQLGDISPRKAYGAKEVEGLYQRNMAELMPGWKSALTASTTANEADLIRSGLDAGSSGNANERRAEIASRMATALVGLQGQARTGALNEIAQYQSQEDARVAHELGLRNLAFSETGQVHGSTIPMYGQTPSVLSAILNRDIGSGIYTGMPGTSASTTAWSSLPTARFTGMPGTSSLGATLNIGSATNTQMPGSYGFSDWLGNPTMTSAGNIYNPTGYLTAMSNTFMKPNSDPATGMTQFGKGLAGMGKGIDALWPSQDPIRPWVNPDRPPLRSWRPSWGGR